MLPYYISVKFNDANLLDYLEQTKDKPVISILDANHKPDKSTIVGFVQHGTKLKFTVNLNRAKKNSVIFDSHLLRIAVNVYR